MANEPHHVLAMAYHQSLVVFAKALQNQTQKAGSVDVEFARAAVSEMRRSHGEMKQHHQGHMRTMSAEMTATMSGMMQRRETHEAELNTRLTALEQEVQSATPDAKRVSTLAASVHSHLDAMSKMKPGSKGTKMTTMRQAGWVPAGTGARPDAPPRALGRRSGRRDFGAVVRRASWGRERT